MVLVFGIILFIVCCIMESLEEASYQARQDAIKHHRELIEALSKEREVSVRKTKVTRRRIAKDKEGNTLAEEITEEEL